MILLGGSNVEMLHSVSRRPAFSEDCSKRIQARGRQARPPAHKLANEQQARLWGQPKERQELATVKCGACVVSHKHARRLIAHKDRKSWDRRDGRLTK